MLVWLSTTSNWFLIGRRHMSFNTPYYVHRRLPYCSLSQAANAWLQHQQFCQHPQLMYSPSAGSVACRIWIMASITTLDHSVEGTHWALQDDLLRQHLMQLCLCAQCIV